MGKNEDSSHVQQSLPKHKRIQKVSNLSLIGDGQISPIPTSKACQIILTNKPPFLDENIIKEKEIFQSNQAQINEQNSQRKPLQDITNFSSTTSSNSKKVDKTKHTRHFTYLTFLDKTAARQFRVYLYVDRELGIPNEYAHKLMDHVNSNMIENNAQIVINQSVDNDVATDDEQIQNATRKLRGALEEEVFRKKELEEELLEYLTFVEVEKWEADSVAREQAERQKSIREFQMLIKNEKISSQSKNPLEPLIEKIFISYQRSCAQPLRIKSHERLLYKSLEKSIPKFIDSFRNKSATYRNFLMRRQTIEAQQAQKAFNISKSSGSSNQNSMILSDGLSELKVSGSDIRVSLS